MFLLIAAFLGPSHSLPITENGLDHFNTTALNPTSLETRTDAPIFQKWGDVNYQPNYPDGPYCHVQPGKQPDQHTCILVSRQKTAFSANDNDAEWYIYDSDCNLKGGEIDYPYSDTYQNFYSMLPMVVVLGKHVTGGTDQPFGYGNGRYPNSFSKGNTWTWCYNSIPDSENNPERTLIREACQIGFNC